MRCFDFQSLVSRKDPIYLNAIKYWRPVRGTNDWCVQFQEESGIRLVEVSLVKSETLLAVNRVVVDEQKLNFVEKIYIKRLIKKRKFL